MTCSAFSCKEHMQRSGNQLEQVREASWGVSQHYCRCLGTLKHAVSSVQSVQVIASLTDSNVCAMFSCKPEIVHVCCCGVSHCGSQIPSFKQPLWQIPAKLLQVEIPEIEFTIRPKAERRVDTIYNMMLGWSWFVHNIFSYVRNCILYINTYMYIIYMWHMVHMHLFLL